ncbi:hypothetical protein HDV05_002191 [Chytridiales sp. JEL 0842]|nr:hypothetical protein HDV05_002191 [Chytridiales sp. JEL 0842]
MDAIKNWFQKGPESARKKSLYKIQRKLGEGTFGVVKEAIYIPTGELYAIKSIKKVPESKNKRANMIVRREMSILKEIRGHENLIQMFDFFETKDTYYMVFELATGGELFDRIAAKGRFTERDAADILYQILNGISYLHSHGIVHRDLKPENILYKTREENSDIVIADFGVANVVHEDQMLSTVCGSPAYAAPEILRRKGHGPAVDIWSIGVITFTIVMGYGPWYYCEDMPSMLDAIVKGRWKFESPYADKVSKEAQTFIKTLMSLDPSKRPTARQCLCSRWVLMYSLRANKAAKKAQEIVRKASTKTAEPRTSSVTALQPAPVESKPLPNIKAVPEETATKVTSKPPTKPMPPTQKPTPPATPPPTQKPTPSSQNPPELPHVIRSKSSLFNLTSRLLITNPLAEPQRQDPKCPFLNLNLTLQEDVSSSLNWLDPIETPAEKKEEEDVNLVDAVWNASPAPVFNPKVAFKGAVKAINATMRMEKDSGAARWSLLRASVKKRSDGREIGGRLEVPSGRDERRASVVSGFSSGDEEEYEDAFNFPEEVEERVVDVV